MTTRNYPGLAALIRVEALCTATLLLFAWAATPLLSQAQPVAASQAGSITPTEEEIVFYTEEWTGERDALGRPLVPDDLLERMEIVSIEEAWGVLRGEGYHNQYAGDWEVIHEDEPIIGRALTAQYMPSSPALEERMREQGHEEGHVGAMNSWPIDMLEQGDVYVATAFGKIKDGTLIGDNLGTAIYSNSGNGVVFDASSRDLGGLKEIEGFNAYVRGWDPSFLQEVMLTEISGLIRIGEAVVLPGDVVLARDGGVIFIPAHLAEEVVETAEVVILRDMFGHQRLEEGTYTPGQIDGEWSDEIQEDFFSWLENNADELPVPEERIREIVQDRSLY